MKKKRRPTKAKGGSTVWKCWEFLFISILREIKNCHDVDNFKSFEKYSSVKFCNYKAFALLFGQNQFHPKCYMKKILWISTLAMGEDLFKPSSFLASSFASSKKEEATKRDPVVLLLHDLMLNAHANSNITRTQTLCPGLSGLNQPSEIDGPRTRVGISYRRPSDGHNNNIDLYDHDQGCRKFQNGWKGQFTFWGIFRPFWSKKVLVMGKS